MKRRAACVAALAAAGCAIGIALCRPAVPGFDAVRARWRPSDAQLLDRRGEPIHELRVDAHGRRLAWTPLADISPALREAVVTSEDRRFQSHHGVDFAALAGSVARRLAGRRGRGASTLTMQVAAMLDPRIARAAMRRRTALQKLRQMLAALALERRWSKAQILEAYLNLVTYRGEIEGVGAAARVMFGKAPDGIDAAEAVVLAALITRAQCAGGRARTPRRGAASCDGSPRSVARSVDARKLPARLTARWRLARATSLASRLRRGSPSNCCATDVSPRNPRWIATSRASHSTRCAVTWPRFTSATSMTARWWWSKIPPAKCGRMSAALAPSPARPTLTACARCGSRARR